MGIKENLLEVRSVIPEGVELVAVSKFHPVSALMEAYDAGQRCFGESRVQELTEKENELPKDIRWHFIGHLQTNKVRHLIGKTALIESVDSERLLRLIDSESRKAEVVTDVLMQVHVAEEETKTGFLPEELLRFFEEERGHESLTNTRILGLMGMATNTDDTTRVRRDFRDIARLYHRLRDNSALGLKGFDRLSMGMSGDWRLAVGEGANIVRIGSAIFGPREY